MDKKQKKKLLCIGEQQAAAAVLFAQGECATLQEVAQKVGVHRSTLWRWRQDKAFLAYCEKVRRELIRELKKEWKKQDRAERREMEKRFRIIDTEKQAEQMANLIKYMKQQNAPSEEIEAVIKSMQH